MKDKQVLLTGGTGGLGLGVTPTVLSQGAAVTIPYANPQHVERLKGRLAPADIARIRFIQADLTREAAVESLIEEMGQVDVLIHLVGGFNMGKLHEYSLEQWQRDFDLNLTTTFLTCKHSLRSMLQHGYGRIVTVGARGAAQPGARLGAYSAAKSGVVALTQAIAAETKGTNITANTILPSIINTPTNREDMGAEKANQWVQPESLAQVVCFLASEAAKDVRGAVIPVYGNL